VIVLAYLYISTSTTTQSKSIQVAFNSVEGNRVSECDNTNYNYLQVIIYQNNSFEVRMT